MNTLMNDWGGERINPDMQSDTDFFPEHLARYTHALPFVSGKRVLDIGCGAGYGAYFLSLHGALSVHGIDEESEAVQFAQEHYRNQNLVFEISDIQTFTKNNYGVVTAFEVIEHIPAPERIIKKISSFLAPSGFVLLSTPYLLNPHIRATDKNNPFHVSTLEPAELVHLCNSSGLTSLRVWYQQKTRACVYRTETISSKLRQLVRRLLRKMRITSIHLPDPPVEITDWEFSDFPSSRSEVIIVLAQKK